MHQNRILALENAFSNLKLPQNSGRHFLGVRPITRSCVIGEKLSFSILAKGHQLTPRQQSPHLYVNV